MKKQKQTEMFDFDQAPLPIGKEAPKIKKPLGEQIEQWIHIRVEKFRRDWDKHRREQEKKREEKRNSKKEMPSVSRLAQELSRARAQRRRMTIFRNVLLSVLVVALLCAGAAMYYPLMRVGGDAMSPALQSGDVVVAVRTETVRRGDLVLFEGAQGQQWVKRVIALGGDQVNILSDGTVEVNGEKLTEAYVQTLTRGDCDVEFPYTVPYGRIFVLGDHRALSVDSRHTIPGCVSEEQIIGRVVWRLLPIERFGAIEP